MKFNSIWLGLCLALSGCGGGGGAYGGASTPAPVTTPSPVTTPPAETVYSADVAKLSALAAFPVGVAVAAGTEAGSIMTSSAAQTVVRKHFSQITAGNIMKMSYLHPAADTFSYGQADELLKFASDNGIKLHGHTLIWHADYQVPGFMKTFTGDKSAWLAMLKTHVQTIATHYAGKLSSWDVVNEALADGGGYRNSLFYQHTGADYIEQAFVNARAADSQVELYYNDYNLESDPAKLATLTAMLDGFAARGVPITGVGFQMHVGIDSPSASTIAAALKQVAERKLKVKITELDIPINNPYSAAYKAGDIKTTYTLALGLLQKKRYCEVVQAYMDAVPPAQRGGVTVWGVDDPSSWLISALFNNAHADWPLLFDAKFGDKPALRGVADAFGGKACTNT